MPEEIKTIVKIPIAEIEETLRTKHILPKVLSDVRIEDNSLVLEFSNEKLLLVTEQDTETLKLTRSLPRKKRRRSRKKRNRMKTRGWEVIARITNSKGQRCSIYKPFVDSLDKPDLTLEEQKTIVERILKSNKNKPSADSIQYFLNNTLEYLRSISKTKLQETPKQ